MTKREFLRELFRPSPREQSLSYREMWRRHPTLSALHAAVAVGLAVLGAMNLVDGGGSRLRSALYLAAWIAWIAMWVMRIRIQRVEPPSKQ